MNRLKYWMNHSLIVIGYSLLIVLLLGTLWQVFTRYVLDNPSVFTEELMTFLLLWISLLGTSYAFGTNQHLSLTFIKDRLHGKKKKIIYALNHSLILLFSFVVLIFGGMSLVISSSDQSSPILGMPMAFVYLICPLAGILIVIYQTMHLVELKYNSADFDVERGKL